MLIEKVLSDKFMKFDSDSRKYCLLKIPNINGVDPYIYTLKGSEDVSILGHLKSELSVDHFLFILCEFVLQLLH